ncbi:TPA: hypothetical protein ACGW3M_001077 [Pseudomonas aeruginosa]|uniref:hypothetical protein n=1 Tax=Pseudomonas aeruginosa TaxID=287 RepID=UPI0027EE32A6|nr:hypothetical protein [Pseudomonas aeruginosa]ELJ2276107.1 hypothetical protein [Pseudomonas aeruginosa]MBX6653816.1 hypothetical protein [Pseudomonas aeruginosa]
MSTNVIQTLHLWTNGDSSVGISGESAEVSAPGWLINSEDYEPQEFRETLEAFRAKMIEAFQVVWPAEQVHAKYDFELRDENAMIDAALGIHTSISNAAQG